MATLRHIQQDLEPLSTAAPESLLDLMLAYRDVSAWGDVAELIDAFPKYLTASLTVQEQLAMALNRRNGQGDRARAKTILINLINKHGPSPETNGILGRVYKDEWRSARDGGRPLEAEGALAEAVRVYEQGFDADPRDYYPGINAVTLSLHQPGDDAAKRVQRLVPVVAFAVARRGGLGSHDYWDLATLLELRCAAADWPDARTAAAAAVAKAEYPWNLRTTIGNLEIIHDALVARGTRTSDLDDVIRGLETRARIMEAGKA